jgi:hypothetical protein
VTTVEAPVTVPALVTDASAVNTTVAATAPSNASSTTPAAEDASSEGEAVTATIAPEEASEDGPANTTSASSTNTTHTNMTVSDGEAEGVMVSSSPPLTGGTAAVELVATDGAGSRLTAGQEVDCR